MVKSNQEQESQRRKHRSGELEGEIVHIIEFRNLQQLLAAQKEEAK